VLETLHCLFALIHYLQLALVFLLLDRLALLLLVLHKVVMHLLTNYLPLLEIFNYLKAHRGYLAQSALRLLAQTAASRRTHSVNFLDNALLEEMVLKRKVSLDESLENGDAQLKVFTDLLCPLVLRDCETSSDVVDDLGSDSLISAQILNRKVRL
jgi:hypothetical protein